MLSPLLLVPLVASATPGPQVDLMAQMRLMIEDVLDQKLLASSSELLIECCFSSFSCYEERFSNRGCGGEVEQNKIVERLAALQTSNYSCAAGAPQNSGNSPQDSCFCAVRGFRTLLRSEVVADVE